MPPVEPPWPTPWSPSTPTPTTRPCSRPASWPRRPTPATAWSPCSRPTARPATPTARPTGAGEALGAAAPDRGRGRRPPCSASTAVVFLGYGDSGSGPRRRGRPAGCVLGGADVDEAAERLAAVLREEAADVLTVYDRYGGYGHPDHVQVHRVGLRAAELAGTAGGARGHHEPRAAAGRRRAGRRPRLRARAQLPARDVRRLVPARRRDHHVVDVTGQLDRKRAAMAAHASQATSAEGRTPAQPGRVASLPDDYFALAFAKEWFVRRSAAPGRPSTTTCSPAWHEHALTPTSRPQRRRPSETPTTTSSSSAGSSRRSSASPRGPVGDRDRAVGRRRGGDLRRRAAAGHRELATRRSGTSSAPSGRGRSCSSRSCGSSTWPPTPAC